MKKFLGGLLLLSMSIFVSCSNQEETINEKKPVQEEVNKNDDIDKDNKVDTSDKEKPTDKVIINNNIKEINTKLYLYNEKSNKWETQNIKIKENRTKDLIIKLRNNPKSKISKNTGIDSVTIYKDVATVDVSKNFLEYKDEERLKIRVYSIVNTLCLNKELGIKGVMFLIDGKRVQKLGNIDGNVVLKPNLSSQIEKPKELKVKMYIYDVVNDKWESIDTTVKTNKIKDLIIKLRNNPKSGIPKNTKINSVTIYKGVATVDLGKEFLNPNTESSAGSMAKIYSIVNTLCLNEDLGIEGVMFLIDGEKVDVIGQSDGNKVFKPNK